MSVKSHQTRPQGLLVFQYGGKREDTGDEVEKSFLASVTSYSLLENEKEMSNCLYR